MSFGIVEVITLLLGLAGFGLQPNPQAPTADRALQYALPGADVVVHVDAVSIVPGNYKALRSLENQPAIKASPELAKMVRKAVGEIEGARGLARAAIGLDLASDIHDATMFVQIVPRARPNVVATVHGTFTPALIDKIGAMAGGKVSALGNGTMVEMGGDQPAIGVTRDGVLIAGTASLVSARLAATWTAPKRAPGSSLAYAAAVLGQKPVFALVLAMSKTARAEAIAEIGGKNFLTDVIQRHQVASFSVFHDGIGWTWIDRTRAGLDAMATMSEGALDLLRAAQVAPRGAAKIALAALESYRGTDRNIDALIRRKADVMKIVETYTGDGNFAVKLDKNPRTLELTVRATGKSLSEVVPTGLVVPLALTGLLVGRGEMEVGGPVMMERAAPAPIGAPRAKPAPSKGAKPAKPAAKK